MVTHNDPNRDDPRYRLRDEEARDSARLAKIIAAIAGLIALVAFIVALAHNHNGDFAPKSCDSASDYVCEPETQTRTTTVDVPTTSLSPTEVPVPTVSQSEIVTTTVVPK